MAFWLVKKSSPLPPPRGVESSMLTLFLGALVAVSVKVERGSLSKKAVRKRCSGNQLSLHRPLASRERASGEKRAGGSRRSEESFSDFRYSSFFKREKREMRPLILSTDRMRSLSKAIFTP